MCNVFISGATGKVGRILIEEILEDVDLKLAGGSASKESKDLGKDLGALIGRSNININILKGISNEKDIDLIIDFSRPQNAIQVSRFARKENIPMLIGTTGFNEDELTEINDISKEIPLLIAPNTSMGVALFKKIIDNSKEVLNLASSIEIHEQHHKEKKDSPSGTALMLGEAAADGRGTSLTEAADRGRDGTIGARNKGSIGFASIRGGDIVGRHDVLFASNGEQLTLSHNATDRNIFARGALKAVLWGRDKQPGQYDICLLYTSPSPRDVEESRMPWSA